MKKKTVSYYKKKLDKIFSEYIRKRDRKCFTCYKEGDYRSFDNSHLFSRARLSIRFNEMNCHAQCKACHLAHHKYSNEMYRQEFINRFGKASYHELYLKSQALVKYDIDWYQEQIDIYTEKLRSLEYENIL